MNGLFHGTSQTNGWFGGTLISLETSILVALSHHYCGAIASHRLRPARFRLWPRSPCRSSSASSAETALGRAWKQFHKFSTRNVDLVNVVFRNVEPWIPQKKQLEIIIKGRAEHIDFIWVETCWNHIKPSRVSGRIEGKCPFHEASSKFSHRLMLAQSDPNFCMFFSCQ